MFCLLLSSRSSGFWEGGGEGKYLFWAWFGSRTWPLPRARTMIPLFYVLFLLLYSLLLQDTNRGQEPRFEMVE